MAISVMLYGHARTVRLQGVAARRHPDEFAGCTGGSKREITLMGKHRLVNDRQQRRCTALALARFVLWLGWLVWTLVGRDATR
ncbi:hypothetical protein [Nonomuraea thailandensis]|uniref:hypothetical protein n=1 Tax=Nonomuraea thailandensis TaxID=1188745 RepID=UPI0020A322A9|nr:hypothetical protein [Nonomuraea thailandensis]